MYLQPLIMITDITQPIITPHTLFIRLQRNPIQELIVLGRYHLIIIPILKNHHQTPQTHPPPQTHLHKSIILLAIVAKERIPQLVRNFEPFVAKPTINSNRKLGPAATTATINTQGSNWGQ